MLLSVQYNFEFSGIFQWMFTFVHRPPKGDPKRGILPTNRSKVTFESLSSHLGVTFVPDPPFRIPLWGTVIREFSVIFQWIHNLLQFCSRAAPRPRMATMPTVGLPIDYPQKPASTRLSYLSVVCITISLSFQFTVCSTILCICCWTLMQI